MLAALRERAASGRGQLVDLAETDALATTFASVAAHAQYQGELEQRNVVWFRDPLQGPLPAADGYFHLMLGRSDFFRLALHVLELPELAEDERFESRAARLELAPEWVPSVRERVAAREKLELFEALTSARVVAGPVLDAAELAANEHLAARGFFVQPEGGGDRACQGPAARLSATPPRLRRAAPAPGSDGASVLRERRNARDATPPPGGARSRPLEGLRALALTQVWAGAHCAQQLALLGAEVIKIEARRRPDTWRGGYEMPILTALQDRPTARRGWNCHPSFNSGNLNQLGVTLDLQTARGHPALPAAAALDRHRRRELHAACPRQPRDWLRGNARVAAGRDPLLDQRLRSERPLPRSSLQRRHDRARLRHVIAARFPRRAAS